MRRSPRPAGAQGWTGVSGAARCRGSPPRLSRPRARHASRCRPARRRPAGIRRRTTLHRGLQRLRASHGLPHRPRQESGAGVRLVPAAPFDCGRISTRLAGRRRAACESLGRENGRRAEICGGREARAGSKSAGGPLFYHGPLPRRPLRLAEFLYFTGRISWQSLISALVWQRAVRPRFGELARELRSITSADLAKILASKLRHEQTGKPPDGFACSRRRRSSGSSVFRGCGTSPSGDTSWRRRAWSATSSPSS